MLGILIGLLGAQASDGLRERVGGRGALMERLAHLEGVDGSPPQVYFEEEADAWALGFLVRTELADDGRVVAEVVPRGRASGGCRVALSRDPDLTWVMVRQGTCRERDVVAPPPPPPPPVRRLPWLGASMGPGLGNRGGGGTLRISGGVGWDERQVGLEVGGRLWGLTELAPELRVAGGADVLVRAGEAGFIELGAGYAGLYEEASPCPGCAVQSVTVLGPSVSGALGLRGPISGSALDGIASLGVRSLPQRRFSVVLTVGVVSRRRE